MIKKYTLTILSLSYCLVFMPINVLAQLPGMISVGMSPADVIKLRGAPIDKDEHETSRKIIWRYKDGVVVFKNGKVIKTKDESVNKVLNKDSVIKKSSAKKGTGEDLSQKEVDDIIAAIPNDTGKPNSNPMPGGASSQ